MRLSPPKKQQKLLCIHYLVFIPSLYFTWNGLFLCVSFLPTSVDLHTVSTMGPNICLNQIFTEIGHSGEVNGKMDIHSEQFHHVDPAEMK